jgi:valyl-tRNA synthetase
MKSPEDMAKAYDPKSVEDTIYKEWESSGGFAPNEDADGDPFSIVLPPPNVTGTLHMGHAAMLAIEDAMVRFARMQGRPTVWIPGTDHAAIATQSKVEKILKEESGQTRHDIGREPFLQKVHDFAQDSHDTIVGQMRKMGASVDWSREAYTLDEARHEAVNAAFKRMFDDGLIYRGHRVINWDPLGQTTVSDDEVVHKEGKATLYTFTYGPECPIEIATTRPETKIGDTAIAVHPDGKWKEYIGQEFTIENFAGVKLNLKVVGDDAVEADFGTGALGVTPAHSQIDAEIAERHDLETIPVIGKNGCIIEEKGIVVGQSAKEARKTIAAWLEESGLLISAEEVDQNISTAERSGGVIEPLPMEQWFINVNKEFAFKQSEHAPIEGIEDGQMVTLKKLMKQVVDNGQIEILPNRFEKTYHHWIDNLRDWNISRQIWFGHRIPVWTKDGEMTVGTEPEGEGWEQDPDTLDTWFSSGLWTFSTLGWPSYAEASDGKPVIPMRNRQYHPISVLETGYDILFFWVARMILMTTYLLGEVPFKTVYLHGLVRDAEGKKMSKSLGNIINPLDMIESYGADATRLSLLIGASPGNDMKLSTEKIEGFRNFTNKLWNISRFVLTSAEGKAAPAGAPEPKTLADKWILARYAEVRGEVTRHFEAHEYSLLGEKLRDFTWNEFADWYLEIAKIQKARESEDGSTDEILLYILENLLKLWHPFMPFVTEEIYKVFGRGQLMTAAWPEQIDAPAENDFVLLQEIISSIRAVRSEYKVEPAKFIEAHIAQLPDSLQSELDVIMGLARLSAIHVTAVESDAASIVLGDLQVQLPLEGMVDKEAEKERLAGQIAEAENRAKQLEGRLSNDDYVNNAPEEIVESTRNQLKETQELIETTKNELARYE